jgi:hypothetical protein
MEENLDLTNKEIGDLIFNLQQFSDKLESYPKLNASGEYYPEDVEFSNKLNDLRQWYIEHLNLISTSIEAIAAVDNGSAKVGKEVPTIVDLMYHGYDTIDAIQRDRGSF